MSSEDLYAALSVYKNASTDNIPESYLDGVLRIKGSLDNDSTLVPTVRVSIPNTVEFIKEHKPQMVIEDAPLIKDMDLIVGYSDNPKLKIEMSETLKSELTDYNMSFTDTTISNKWLVRKLTFVTEFNVNLECVQSNIDLLSIIPFPSSDLLAYLRKRSAAEHVLSFTAVNGLDGDMGYVQD